MSRITIVEDDCFMREELEMCIRDSNRRVVADAAALFVLQKVDKCATAQ